MSLLKGSSSEDFFRSLTNGARFNKSKNDVKMFSNRGKPEKHTIKTLSTKQNDKELHYKTSKKKGSKQPEPDEKIEDDEEFEDDDFIEEEEDESTESQISLFSSSTPATATTKKDSKKATTPAKIKDVTSTAVMAAEGSSKKGKKGKKANSVTSILLTQMNLAPEFQAQIENIERIHHLNGIKVSGNDIVAPIEHFSELRERLPGIDPRVLRNLKRYSIDDPSPIQMQAIPSMGLGREVIGVAPTGSGKTLAYVLPLIHLLTSSSSANDGSDAPAEGKRGYRSIVLSPTRELAQQIYRVFKRYCEGIRMRVCLLTRGIMDKKATLPKGAFDVLVATPLRLVNMIKDGSVDLSGVQTLVLDEADRLFDEQFVGQIDEIAAACKEARESAEKKKEDGGDDGAARSLQVCLFSATMLPQVEQLAASIMRDPVRILVGHRNVPLRSIKQSLIFCGNEEGKLLKMVSMVREGAVRVPCLVFVQSKERGSELKRLLSENGVRNVVDINSDKSESERARIIDDFRVGKIWFLISTEIMARGMDFPGICSVINYDFPQSNASYVHRVGRTGRGTSVDGTAFTFFTETDAGFLRTIANSVKAAGCEVPQWMLELKPLDKAQRKRLEKMAPKRINVGGAADKKNGPANFKVDYESLTNRERALVVRSGGKRGRKDENGPEKKKRKGALGKKKMDGKRKKEIEESDDEDDEEEEVVNEDVEIDDDDDDEQ